MLTSIFVINLAGLIIYDDSSSYEVSEVVDLNKVEWKPCSKRARKFVPLDGKPVFSKVSWKPSLKFADALPCFNC